MHISAMWLMTPGSWPGTNCFSAGFGLHWATWQPSMVLGSLSPGQPGLLWWLFSVSCVTDSHAPTLSCLTFSLCSRMSLFPWGSADLEIYLVPTCVPWSLQPGQWGCWLQAAEVRLMTINNLALHALACTANVTTAVLGSGFLKPEGQSWGGGNQSPKGHILMKRSQEPSFSLSDG